VTAKAKLKLPPEFTERAKQIWAEYQTTHGVSALKGQVAAINPETGRVWIGPDGLDMIDRMEADAVVFPVYLVRVGYDYMYVRGRGPSRARLERD
jgi:hypothetical protein